MSWNNIKIDKADKTFSQYIRLRDGQCVRCHSPVNTNDKGLPISHQASHYWSRRNEGTRFDPSNLDCLCPACHRRWGGDYREEYKNFKMKQLGETHYDLLYIRAHTTCKKDRKMSLIIARELLKTIYPKE